MALRALRSEWLFPVRTIVGAGRRLEIPALLASRGASKPLVVTDRSLAEWDAFRGILAGLSEAGLKPTAFTEVSPNPLDTDIASGAQLYRDVSADSLVIIGGGSALDAGKSIAMIAESGLKLAECDYFADPRPVPAGGRLAPCVLVPSTAGTGAEMNSGSMYTDTRELVKRCAGHPELPITVVLDPEVTLSLPASLTAWTGMDAVVHALEAFFVPDYHPMCDGIALEALRRIQYNLPRAYADGSDLEARTEMLVASSMAAVAFQKGLGAVHGLSEPIGAVFNTHHGWTNAVILPHMLRDLGGAIEERCSIVAHALHLPKTGSSSTAAVTAWAEELNEKMNIPNRLGLSFDEGKLQEMAVKAAQNPTGFTNAVPFSAEDYARVLRAAN